MVVSASSIVNASTCKRLELTLHAIQRWNERGDGSDLADRLQRAVPFGAQFDSCMFLADEEFVWPVAGKRVLTTLTKRQAVASLSRMARKPNIDVFLPDRTTPGRSRQKVKERIVSVDAEGIAQMAAVHVAKGLPRSKRNEEFKATGMDIAGAEGVLYRCAVEAAQRVCEIMFHAAVSGDRQD